MSDPDLAGLRQLLAVMERLRDPRGGCPWDRAQTSKSIAPYTIEEACEVAEAAESGDAESLQDELGDLLFHVVFHARIAEEAGQFAFDDVAREAAAKLERRHPHVFGEERNAAPEDLNQRWERAKAAERGGIDEKLPPDLPALMSAHKLQRRAAAVGFDWPEQDGPRAKILEELDEIDGAAEVWDEAVAEELGDLLFAVVNFSRHLKVEPEQALRAANRKFTRRFRYIEQRLAARGQRPQDLDLAGLDALWDEAKRNEQGH